MSDVDSLVLRAGGEDNGGGICFAARLTGESLEFWQKIVQREKDDLYVNRQEVTNILVEEYGVKTSRTSVKDHLNGRCMTCRRSG